MSNAKTTYEAQGRLRGPPRVQLDANTKGGAKVDLRIRLDDIPDDGLRLEETLPASWVTVLLGSDIPDGDEPWVAAEDATIDLKLRKEAETVRLTGSSRFVLNHTCVRCLQSVPFEVQPHFELRLVEHKPEWEGAGLIDLDPHGLSGMMEHEPGGEGDLLNGEEEDLATYQKRTVDVPRLVREQVFLDLPMHPSCKSPESRTTSPCADDIDDGQGPERERWVASRWEGLAAMRDQFPSADDAAKDADSKEK